MYPEIAHSSVIEAELGLDCSVTEPCVVDIGISFLCQTWVSDTKASPKNCVCYSQPPSAVFRPDRR